MIVVGVDPAMAAFGLASVEYHFLGGEREPVEREILSAEVWRTAPGQFDAMKSFDNAKRGGFVGRVFARFLDRLPSDPPALVAVEAPGGARNAGTCLKLGVAIGAVMAVVETRGIPFVLMTPQTLKTRVAASPQASKAQVASGIRGSGVNGCGKVSNIKPDGVRHHAWDAVGAAIAAEEDALFRHIVQVTA